MKTVTQKAGDKTPMAKEQETVKQPAQNPSSEVNYEEDAGAGFERGKHNIGDFKVPFLTILQGLSPQCTQGNPKYNEDARPGQVVNTVTGDIYETRQSKQGSIVVVALDRVTEYPEWKPQRGGLVGVHKTDAILKQTKKGTGEKDSNTDYLPNGNVIDTTSKWFVMLQTEDGFIPCIIAMSRTQLKHSRTWLTKIGSYKGKRADGSSFPMPMFSRYWKLSTIPEMKDQNTYFSWQMEPGELVKKQDDYLELKGIREAVVSGQLALPDATVDPEAHNNY